MTKNSLLREIIFPTSVIILLTAIAYSNTFSNSFHFDDRYAIFEDRAIRDIGNIPSMFKDMLNRPLLRITFALNYHFGGFDVFGYHLVNLLLHIIAGISVYFLAKLLFERMGGHGNSVSFALLAGLIFALHPVQTGSVTYIASRSAVLAAIFYVLSVILFILGSERNGSKMVFFHIGAFLSFLMALGSKETAATVPFIVLMLPFFLMTAKHRRNITLPLLWLMALPVYALIRYLVSQNVVPVDTRFSYSEILPPYQYLLTEVNVVIYYYLKWLFFPVNGPNADPDIPAETSFIDISTIAASLVIACIVYMAIRFRREVTVVSFGIFWYFITLIPTSSIFPIADVAVERHLYLPSIGFAFVSAYLLMKIKELLPSKIWFLPYIIPLIMIVITIQTNSVWKNGITLWEDAARKSPNKIRALGNRAFAYLESGNLNMAEMLYHDFLKRFPNDPFGYNNTGLILEKKGDVLSAIKYYREAVNLKPKYWRFHMHLGNAYSQNGFMVEAVSELQIAVNLEPLNPEPMIMLASLLAKQGETDSVIIIANKALSIESENVEAYLLLGISYEKKGMREEAIKFYKKALELNPGWRESLTERIKTMTGN
ncbi:MAG: tetratricopeptide repeat protein [Deltaproteobacteria bacterium]|nr:tetratricopeptide repeat protein [Deltaproteobacteria bacterium]